MWRESEIFHLGEQLFKHPVPFDSGDDLVLAARRYIRALSIRHLCLPDAQACAGCPRPGGCGPALEVCRHAINSHFARQAVQALGTGVHIDEAWWVKRTFGLVVADNVSPFFYPRVREMCPPLHLAEVCDQPEQKAVERMSGRAAEAAAILDRMRQRLPAAAPYYLYVLAEQLAQHVVPLDKTPTFLLRCLNY